jgi:hypothetical protein
MRTEMANTTSALTSKAQKELAARMAAEAEAEALRLNMGGMKQHMAKTAAELERERQTAAAMKDRVNKLNANFIQTSECGGLLALHAPPPLLLSFAKQLLICHSASAVLCCTSCSPFGQPC